MTAGAIDTEVPRDERIEGEQRLTKLASDH